MRISILLILLAFAGCSSGRLDMEREAERATKKLDRAADKAKVALKLHGHIDWPQAALTHHRKRDLPRQVKPDLLAGRAKRARRSECHKMHHGTINWTLCLVS